MARLTPGTRLGSYDIIALLGTGGMGEVYRARDPRLGRDVAIKVLHDGMTRDRDRLARFEREARAVAALNHPNIVTLFALEDAGHVRFLVMELVEGRSLDQVIVPGGLPLGQALDVAHALADALTVAHDRGVVHRDLKPSNIMITPGGRVKVLDFGLAKLARTGKDERGTQALTLDSAASGAAQVFGTVPYMAPEQLRGEAADARSDLFALGIVIYELLSGERPFRGATMAEVASAILRDEPRSLRELRPDVVSDLAHLVARCLDKDRAHRIQHARDLRQELELLRAEWPTPGPAPAPHRPAPATPAAAGPSIAVLPFVNRSPSPEDEYFADGLADELLNVLAKIRGLRVAARTSSSTFKGKAATIAEVGAALRVATVLEGSVRKSGNRVRIAVQLVNVADGYHLWSETYDRTLDDIFAVQDEIAQAVVKELRATLLGEAGVRGSSHVRAEVAAAAHGRGVNAEVHRLYLQGKYFVDRLTEDDSRKGVAFLEQAVAQDPGNARAWVQLASGYATQGSWGWVPVVEATKRARTAAERAVAIAPDLAEAHAVLGWIQSTFEWRWKDAEASFERALRLTPNLPHVLWSSGMVAQTRGRLDEAIDLFHRCLEQDPLNSRAYGSLGLAYRATGRIPEALEAYRKALDLSPQRITAHFMRALLLVQLGHDEEALGELQLEPAHWARLCGLAVAHHAAGRHAESDQALAELTAAYSADAAYQIAAAHAVRGEREATFEWLERAYAQHDPGLPQLMNEPLFTPFRADPRFAALAARLGLAA
jgi:serine/threonine protein kinase/Tfp pilus assembly protein PilF